MTELTRDEAIERIVDVFDREYDKPRPGQPTEAERVLQALGYSPLFVRATINHLDQGREIMRNIKVYLGTIEQQCGERQLLIRERDRLEGIIAELPREGRHAHVYVETRNRILELNALIGPEAVSD